ncbi:hypothetical protein HanPI659440_Chr10g0373341 [Helianthus annuus]|nr:hypothetical protein HanPI659440_Chr10g0373341 [Helianthus annuus]
MSWRNLMFRVAHKFDSDKLGRSLEMNGSNGYKFKYEARKDAR